MLGEKENSASGLISCGKKLYLGGIIFFEVEAWR